MANAIFLEIAREKWGKCGKIKFKRGNADRKKT